MTAKVVILGPVCAGKTSFVRAVADQTSHSTEAPTTSAIGKEHTTVGMDVGIAQVEGHRVHVFGTPGQERFAYMWDILLSGADGVVLLIPADRQDAVSAAERVAADLPSATRLPMAVGVTRCDCADAPVVPAVERTFEARPAFTRRVDARATDECRSLLASLLHEIESEGE
jgi:signal recognition particle receptor subunit beta